MKKLNFLTCGLLSGALLLSSMAMPAAQAQDEGATEVEEIVVIGSRRQEGRAVQDSPVAVGLISGDDFVNQGATDMDSLLANLVQSYNVNQQPIADAATLIRPANLRGLSPDATLVLVNGKRRHRAAVITFLGAGISDGSQAPDLSVIPSLALERVEVLYDGSAAQYGSDAIAGILNFILKEDSQGGAMEARWGRYYEGDGDALNVAGNIGLPWTADGFVNLSFEYKQAEPTSRSVQRGDALGLIAAGNTNIRMPAAQVWGGPEFKYDYKFFANAGLSLDNGSEFYAFGNYAEREVEGGFFFRNPHTRGGVFSGPVVDDSPTIKVADLSADGMSGNCPVVKITNNVPDAAALAAVAASPDCFAFNERFPGGFTPFFGGVMEDFSIAGGLRGEMANGWFYDLSAVYGQSKASFFMRNTINPQLARERTNIPTEYKPGAYIETDSTFDLSFSRPFQVASFFSPLNVAFGFEYREEEFEIEAGDRNSWYVDPQLSQQGFGVGSNGFAGFPPRIAGVNSGSSYAGYLDLEADLSPNLLLGGAIRYENYDEFGDTLNGKLSARLRLADNFSLRGSFSTGFRVPTVGQANVSNVTTAFIGAQLADQATLPPTHPVAQQLGAKSLTPEESTNFALGAVFNAGPMDFSIDYFNIEMTDRIALTTPKNLTPDDITALLAAGVDDARSFTSARYFFNAFDTETQGIDLVASYPVDWGLGSTVFSFTSNWTETDVSNTKPDSFGRPVVSPARVRKVEENLPEIRFALTANHSQGPLRLLARVNYYGEWFEDHLDADGAYPIDVDEEILVDVEAAYSFDQGLTVIVGAQNLFDAYPTDNPHSGVVGAKYPANSPFGFNGGFYYLRALWEF